MRQFPRIDRVWIANKSIDSRAQFCNQLPLPTLGGLGPSLVRIIVVEQAGIVATWFADVLRLRLGRDQAITGFVFALVAHIGP